MCLLVVVANPGSERALVVAANRDERVDRPGIAMTVLQESAPRVLGGRDLLAGGTWLAVNELGVVAGLTNTPTAGGRDETKRSRGALPLAAVRHASAAAAVDALAASVDPLEFNPAWMLVADRRSLFAVTIGAPRLSVSPLAPGVHVLENSPPESSTPKVRHIMGLVGGAPEVLGGTSLARRLMGLLSDHSVPRTAQPAQATQPAQGQDDEGEPLIDSPVAGPAASGTRLAACVHGDGYGTRSAAILTVMRDTARLPVVLAADGPPCRTRFVDRSDLWTAPPPPEGSQEEGAASTS